MTKKIFISADHGMAIIYFLQSNLVPSLLDAGVDVVVLTDDDTKDKIAAKFSALSRGSSNEVYRDPHPKGHLTFEGLRLKQANKYANTVQPRWQWLLSSYLRRVGGSWRINTEAMDSNIWEVWAENGWKFRLGIWIPSALAILVLRSSRAARKALVNAQMRFTPGLYTDLLEKHQPDLVIASTAGWRLDRYLLREAHTRGIPTMAAIVGWDNSSSYTIPGEIGRAHV